MKQSAVVAPAFKDDVTLTWQTLVHTLIHLVYVSIPQLSLLKEILFVVMERSSITIKQFDLRPDFTSCLPFGFSLSFIKQFVSLYLPSHHWNRSIPLLLCSHSNYFPLLSLSNLSCLCPHISLQTFIPQSSPDLLIYHLLVSFYFHILASVFPLVS